MSRAVHLAALACMAAVTVIYAWPLIDHLETSIPGTANDHDVATMVWNVGWLDRALHGHGGVLHTNAVVVPFGADLRLHTYALLQGLLAFPFVGWLGVNGAFNLVLIATLFLNGVLAYALVQREVRHPPAALIAAVCLMLGAPLLSFFKTGRPSFVSLWIVCAALLAATAVLDRPRIWKGVALGFVLVAALLSDFQMVLFTGSWLVGYLGYRFLRDRTTIASRDRLIPLAVAAAIFVAAFFTLYRPALSEVRSGSYPTPTLEDMTLYSFRIWDYVSPAIIPYAYGYDFLIAAVGAVLLCRRRSYLFWLGGGVALLILALGPYLQPRHVPLPFAGLVAWPPLRQFRTPGRLTTIALIGLAITAGYALAHVLRRVRQPALVAALVGVAIAGRVAYALLHDPFPVQTYPDYPVYHRIAREAGDFSLLEVPFEVRSGLSVVGHGGDILEYYQHVHGKRLLNGMVARLPTSVFDCYRSHASLLLLGGEPVRATTGELSRDFDQVLDWVTVRYVLVHRSLLSDELARRIDRFLAGQPRLVRVAVQRDLVIYRVRGGSVPGRSTSACRHASEAHA